NRSSKSEDKHFLPICWSYPGRQQDRFPASRAVSGIGVGASPAGRSAQSSSPADRYCEEAAMSPLIVQLPIPFRWSSAEHSPAISLRPSKRHRVSSRVNLIEPCKIL